MKSLKMNIPVILLIFYELFISGVLLSNPGEFSSTAVVCQAVLLLVLGGMKIYEFLISNKRDSSTAVFKIIGAVLAFILGIMILIDPFASEATRVQVTAVAMLAEAVADIFLMIQAMRGES